MSYEEELKVRKRTWLLEKFPATYTKSSSDPSSFPVVTSLADWLSLAFASSLVFLSLLKRVFRDLILECLRPAKINIEINADRSSMRQIHFQNIKITRYLANSSAAHIFHILTKSFYLQRPLCFPLYLQQTVPSVWSFEKAKKCVFKKKTLTKSTCSNKITIFKVGVTWWRTSKVVWMLQWYTFCSHK